MNLSTATIAIELSTGGDLPGEFMGETKGGDSWGSPWSEGRGELSRRGEWGESTWDCESEDDCFMLFGI